MWVLVRLYHVKSTPGYPWDMDEEKWPDYSCYTIESTEDTEKVAVVLSYELANELANELYSSEQEAIELFKKYGFSKENPITAEWIMDNPQKAVKIMRLIRDNRRYINEENRANRNKWLKIQILNNKLYDAYRLKSVEEYRANLPSKMILARYFYAIIEMCVSSITG